MITVHEYFGIWPHNQEHTKAAYELLRRVNDLLEAYTESGGKLSINPVTKCYISGERFGGFRPEDCPQGAKNSPHKQAMGIDIYDPDNKLDSWLTDKILEKFDLYRESPAHTLTWLHLQSRKTGSGKRTFIP